MQEIEDKGAGSAQNLGNIQIVETQLQTYRTEFDELQKARRETAIGDVPGHLGAGANWVMEQHRENFAGQDRATRDLVLFSRICDELLDRARQMREHDAGLYNEANHNILDLVL